MSQTKSQLINPIDGNINVTGIVTASSFSGNNVNVTGIVTASSFSGNNVNVIGIVTASGFSGVASAARSIVGFGTYRQVGILTGSLATNADLFGYKVATSADGKTIIVGAENDEIGATTGTGVVYVFDRVGSSFNQVGILTGSLAVDS